MVAPAVIFYCRTCDKPHSDHPRFSTPGFNCPWCGDYGWRRRPKYIPKSKE